MIPLPVIVLMLVCVWLQAGPRTCLGQPMALLEATIALGTLLPVRGASHGIDMVVCGLWSCCSRVCPSGEPWLRWCRAGWGLAFERAALPVQGSKRKVCAVRHHGHPAR